MKVKFPKKPDALLPRESQTMDERRKQLEAYLQSLVRNEELRNHKDLVRPCCYHLISSTVAGHFGAWKVETMKRCDRFVVSAKKFTNHFVTNLLVMGK